MVNKNNLLYMIILILFNNSVILSMDFNILPDKNSNGNWKQIQPSTLEYAYLQKNSFFVTNHKKKTFNLSILKKPFSEWSKHEYEVINYIVNNEDKHSKEYGIISDTNVVKFFISLLDFPEKAFHLSSPDTSLRTKKMLILIKDDYVLHSNIWVLVAFKQLIHLTDLNILQKYSKDIKKRLANRDWNSNKHADKKNSYKLISEKYKLELLSLLPLTGVEKEKIIQDKKIPLWVSARLGDSDAEQAIIKKYNKNSSYRIKNQYAEYLSLIGSDKSIKTLVNSFNTPVFAKKGLLCTSFRFEILKKLNKLHWQDKEYTKNRDLLIKSSPCNKKLDNKHFKNFLIWIKKNYNIDISPKNLYMRKDCTEKGNWCDKNQSKEFFTYEEIIKLKK